MPLVEFKADRIEPLQRTTFGEANLKERQDLQRLLRSQIDLIAPGVLVLAEEFGDWEESRRRIDLLCVDRSGDLVVIELKRTEDGGHMELQALRYAAMVSTMTWRQAVDAHARYLDSIGKDRSGAEEQLLEFLGWSEPQQSEFAQNIRIVLVSADFHPEITTTVLWLNQRGLDIRCVRLTLYNLDGRSLVDIQPIIPLPEAQEYQVRIREKERQETLERESGRDLTKFDLTLGSLAKTGLNKRRAILETITYLIAQGVEPDAIAQAIPWRTPGRPILCSVEGALDQEAFLEAIDPADRAHQAERRKRFFTATDDLIQHEGRTYAVSNQWGLRTSEALAAFKERFGGKGFDFREAAI